MSANQEKPKPVTRIDLETVGIGLVSIRQWREGWHEGDAADIDDLTEGSIMFKLMEYEKQGFAVWMADGAHGRALRGKVTRVDFLKIGNEYHIRKYCYGWTAKTPAISDKVVDVQQWLAAAEWCQANGWNVRHWADGARAWKGEVKPVRDRAGILAMRRKVEAEYSHGENIGTNKMFQDFAFDY
jgi:hypothetical protein